MWIIDFFKKISKSGSVSKTVEAKYKEVSEIKVGDSLLTLQGELVIIDEVKETTIIVIYKNKKYERDKSAIGDTLFLNKNIKENDESNVISIVNQQQTQIEINSAEVKKQEEINHQLEINRKRADEKRRQEQLEIVRKENQERKIREAKELEKNRELESRRLERLEVERKKEIEKKLKEQENIQRKKIEEQKLKERLEIKRKQEEKLLQEKLCKEIINEIESSGGLKKDETILFHETYGKGVFVGFDNTTKFIKVMFDSVDKVSQFIYPDTIGKYLFIEKSEKMIKRDELKKNSKNEKDSHEEQKFFNLVSDIVDKKLKVAKEEENLMKFEYNNFSDSYDPFIHQKHQHAINDLNVTREIKNKPYFARVNHGENLKFYIGKNAVDDLVIDWRNKICNLYYQYNIYIGNNEHNLSLIREFEIVSGNYHGFFDKYSKIGNYTKVDKVDNMIADEFLVKIINANREDKKTHDIIQTIQKNQYEIITNDNINNVIVEGCAGSGKTMIMLHRLSYMAFNNHELDMNRVFIISPTRLLNLENSELYGLLKINMAKSLASTELNHGLIQEYYKANKLYNHFKLKNIISNSSLDSNFIKLVYSDDFIGKFKNDIKEIILSKSLMREKLIKLESSKIINQYLEFCENNIEANGFEEVLIKNVLFHDYYENVRSAVKKLSSENVNEKIKSLTIALNKMNRKSETLQHKKRVLENLIEHWELSGKTIFIGDKKKRKVSVEENIFSDVFKYFEVLSSKKVKDYDILSSFPFLVSNFQNAFLILNSYHQVVKKIKRFEEFIQKNNLNYLSEVIEHQIAELKNQNNIEYENTFEFDVFLHLVGCNTILSNLNDKKTILFIDEFQDYAVTEILLYKNIFPNASFNMFGDFNQCINPKGMNKNNLEQLKEINWKIFSINQNYRNAHQITEYINNKFNMNMMPIGIDGSVKHCSILDLISNINLNANNRIAFIIKDMILYEDMKIRHGFDIFENISIISDDDCQIKKGFLNIIPITLVKGLEFEIAYVMPYQMTQNEKYVAYTRALNELIIISN